MAGGSWAHDHENVVVVGGLEGQSLSAEAVCGDRIAALTAFAQGEMAISQYNLSD